MNSVEKYRSRRKARLDTRGIRADDEWKTIKGTHVMVDDGGQISKGPESLKNLSKGKSEASSGIGKEMSPVNMDYDYEDGDDQDDWTQKNLKKLKAIYKEKGGAGIDEEWFKFRMARTTKDLKETSKDDADGVMYDNVKQSWYDGWFRNADSEYKPLLTELVTKSPEMRNAALNLAYDNYKNCCLIDQKEPLPFDQFLVTPIKMYRGEGGQKHLENDVFDAYTFDKKTAEYFSKNSGHGGEPKVVEIEVRPIDTYGSMRSVGEAEIWIPSQLSPVGYRYKQDGVGDDHISRYKRRRKHRLDARRENLTKPDI